MAFLFHLPETSRRLGRDVSASAGRRWGETCRRVLQSLINFVEDLLVIMGVSKSNLLPWRDALPAISIG